MKFREQEFDQSVVCGMKLTAAHSLLVHAHGNESTIWTVLEGAGLIGAICLFSIESRYGCECRRSCSEADGLDGTI